MMTVAVRGKTCTVPVEPTRGGPRCDHFPPRYGGLFLLRRMLQSRTQVERSHFYKGGHLPLKGSSALDRRAPGRLSSPGPRHPPRSLGGHFGECRYVITSGVVLFRAATRSRNPKAALDCTANGVRRFLCLDESPYRKNPKNGGSGLGRERGRLVSAAVGYRRLQGSSGDSL